MKKIALLVLITLMAMNASAYKFFITYQGHNIYFNELSRNDLNGFKYMNVEVTYFDTNYNSYSGDVVVPDSFYYDGYFCNVTSIGTHAFQGCPDLTSVDLGRNLVTNISNYAFCRSENVKLKALPSTVKTIGKGAFMGCTSQTNLTFTQNTTIGEEAFSECTSLTKLTIPSGCTLGEKTFYGCESVKKLIIEDNSCNLIPDGCFMCCKKLNHVVIGNGVKTLGLSAFASTDIDTLTIGSDAIVNKKFTAIDNLDWSFSIYHRTCVYTFTDDVKGIGDYAFYGSLPKSVKIGDGVERIGTKAFYRGYVVSDDIILDVDTLYLGKNVKEIGEDIFDHMHFDKIIINTQYLLKMGDYFCFMLGCYSRVTEVGEGITELGENSLHNPIGDHKFLFTEFKLPSTLRVIGARALANNNMKSIDIPKYVETIGYYSLMWCDRLQLIRDFSMATISEVAYGYEIKQDCVVYTTYASQAEKYRKLGFKRVFSQEDSGTTGALKEDVNDDGQVNSLDVLKVYKYMQTH